MKVLASVQKFFAEEDGITALEYGILACLVAGALVLTFYPALKTLYQTLFTQMGAAVGTAAAPAG
jgi:pilus assembly protein Flp/PilA